MKDWALILGASSGIGAELAIRFASRGINVYGIHLRKKQEDIEILKKEISKFGTDCIFKKINASNEQKMKEVILEINKLGNIRIKFFIHSIAFGTLKKMIGESDSLNKKNINMTMDAMCNNLIYWSQELYLSNLLKKGSHILAMTSAGGRKNWSNYGAISIAKAGIESVCRQLSLELALDGISVNAIQAGVTETKALKKIPEYKDMVDSALKNNPHKRLTRPSDIADFIELMINYDSSWMTGNVIRLDGGEDISG